MITLIYGAKGSGKTKRILDAVNDAADKCDGDAVYLTDQSKHSTEVRHTVRFVNYAEYGIKNPDAALGFLKGILSVNNDILQIYIDGLSRMAGAAIPDMESFYKELDALGIKEKTDFILTVSCDEKDLPRFLAKYV
jgi:hypothetical protein